MSTSERYAGDELIANADMVYDQRISVRASAADIHPWLVQLGKGRGGWYLPSWIEHILPQAWHASHNIEAKWQDLAVGDRVEDYGLDPSQDFFIVACNRSPEALIFRSDRYGCSFSWALLLHEAPDESSTEVHLRFRGKIQATGLKRWFIIRGGGFMDWISTRPLLAGLKERVERLHVN